MARKFLASLCVAYAAASLAGPAAAQAQRQAAALETECAGTSLHTHPLADRQASLQSFESVPDGCLRAMFLMCADTSRNQLMDLGSAAACSVGYEVLLKRSFGGDFNALLAWWRSQRGENVRE